MGNKNNSFYMEGIWRHSHEAEECKKLFGLDDRPTCYTTTGYASGYLSTILGMKIIVTEIQCEGKGDDCCHWIARHEQEWKDKEVQALFSFNETSLIKELELAYDQIKEERDNLNKSYSIHKSLTSELIQGHDLQSIANVLFESLDVPIMFEDYQFNVLAAAGLDEKELKKVNEQMKCYKNTKKQRFNEIKLDFHKDFKPAIIQVASQHYRLMIPILYNHQITGYCSLIRPINEFSILENMIIERSSVVCAMYLLNDRTVIEAEQRMRGNILEEILSGKMSKQEIVKMGHYVNVDFLKPFHIVVVSVFHTEHNVKEEIEWKDDLVAKILGFFKKISIPILITHKSDDFVIYIQNDVLNQCNRTIQSLTEEIMTVCSKSYPCPTFFSGFSTKQDNIELAKNQFEEALTAVKLSSKSKPITSYEELGFIGLLIQTGNKDAIRKYSIQVLKDLLEYDNRKGMDLTKTLYHYILNGGNLEQTACSSALSISGLRYRIEKIKDILSVDIRQPSSSYPLFLAIQMLIILGEIQFDL
jgi:sugar diacid utilization regulator